MRSYIIAGNWKMYTTPVEAATLASAILEQHERLQPPHSVKTIICPPYTSLYAAREVIAGTRICLGAQNCHYENKGAFTGEVAPMMLKASGCSYVILGHSERRQYCGETNALVNKKIHGALRDGLIPIYCVGETLIERQNNQTLDIIRVQLVDGLKDVSLHSAEQLVIAYEPVWAIGTGLAATPSQAQEVHSAIRAILSEVWKEYGARVRILYGGSLKPENAEEIFTMPDVDGGLIGGASLQAESFGAILAVACHLAVQ
ncbi:MAG: triose-phosphate isomerase [Bacteroidota bacterium]|nr:triose-phosphate isomerase [Candidatus Kapabacteria bacterium]MDW8220936.1 triose-phosphate isomerase [Bacteroidota bacterium]